MAATKSERILNLLIALLTTKRYVSKSELKEMIEGYRGANSFDRMFERDKSELRALGITIQIGTNDWESDEEDGYRIDRSEFELPAVEFTGDEFIAIGLAAHAWQSSVGAEATATAVQRLRAAGAAPDLGLLPNVHARIPVVEAAFDAIYLALEERREVRFTYGGRLRRIQPWRMTQRRGLWLVAGLDLDHDAVRHYKLARIEDAPLAHGPQGAYEIPNNLDALTNQEPSAATAIIAVRDAPNLLTGAQQTNWDSVLPDGYTAWQVFGITEEMIVSEIVAAGPEAIVLEPPRIRDAVVARLSEFIKAIS